MNALIAPISLLVAAGLVFSAARLAPEINRERNQLQLTFTNKVYDTDTPANTRIMQASLGVFRGMAINYLWLKAQSLKDAGKFHEARDLANRISELQPRFPQVWEFNSWNMAYNISVATRTADERWMWVDNGIRLLREKGIRYNPHSLRLYRQLAWIFQHKIAGSTDDEHRYYQMRLAQEWHAILGPPPQKRDKASYVQWLTAIRDAAPNAEALLRRQPELAPAVSAIREQGVAIDAELLRALLAREQSVDGQPTRRQRLERILNGLEPPLRAALLNTARRAAVDYYNMDIAVMIELGERFAPIDWRHPAAHSLYWTYRGLQMHGARKQVVEDDMVATKLNSERGVIHSLQLLAERGQVIYDPTTNYHATLPDPAMIDSYIIAYDLAIQAGGPDSEMSFGPGFQNFLDFAVRTAWTYGDKEKARELYARVQQKFRRNDNPNDKYWKSIEQFIQHDNEENIDSIDDALAVSAGLIYQSIIEGYINQRPDVTANLRAQAEMTFARYVQPELDRKTHTPQRLPPNFGALNEMVLAQFLLEPSFNPLLKARVWAVLEDGYRAALWSVVADALREQCTEARLSFDQLFPAPIGQATRRDPQPTTQGVIRPDVERK